MKNRNEKKKMYHNFTNKRGNKLNFSIYFICMIEDKSALPHKEYDFSNSVIYGDVPKNFFSRKKFPLKLQEISLKKIIIKMSVNTLKEFVSKS